MRIRSDRDRCVASGACVYAAPQVFDQDDDGIVVVLDERPDPARHDEAKAGIRACPAVAIWAED